MSNAMSKLFLGFALVLFTGTESLKAQVNINFLGQLNYAQELANIWGWYNPVDGKEYALVGLTTGMSIVDVSDPTTPDELYNIPWANSLWRELKTWGNYAYVTNESGGGLLIVDMSNLPASINTYAWTGGSLGFTTAHTIFIDENGVAYLCGSNGALGTLFLDVAADPINPPVLGSYTTRYVHDTYVRGDTMWAAEINNGIFSVVDVSDKSAPVVLATQSTTSNFTHNVWLNEDASLLFTTDEVSSANVDAYDVSDLSDIQLLDTWKSNPGSGVIPHNVYIVQDRYLVTAYYRDGVTITDATQPDNLLQTGSYDTSPFSGDGFNGAWGVYPYLPSGNLLISDIEEGLFVLGPTYEQAAYLRGLVTDSVTGTPIPGVQIELTDAPDFTETTSNPTGNYATGSYSPGVYTVKASRSGYVTREVSGVTLATGSETTLNLELAPVASFVQTGWVRDSITGQPVGFAKIAFQNEDTLINTTADELGQFDLPEFYPGNYTAFAGKWGYRTGRFQGLALDAGFGPLVLEINRGWYDDFLFHQGWTVNTTATSGQWARDIPIGTNDGVHDVNPYFDIYEDFGEACFMTGNGGGSPGTDDVDNGTTTLTSPLFDLSAYGDPHIRFDRWFYNGGGTSAPNDSLFLRLHQGLTIRKVDMVTDGDPFESQWRTRDIRVQDYFLPGPSMRFSAVASDALSSGHWVEGGLDRWSVYDAAATAVPTAGIDLPALNPCAGLGVTFQDASVGYPITWFWSFPGGTPSEAYEANPTVIYETPGVYSISLTVYNGNGTATVVLSDAISVLDSLSLELNSTPSLSGTDGTASVNDISGGTPPYVYLWNDPAAQTTKTAISLAPGTYTVMVTSSEGCSASGTVTVSDRVSGVPVNSLAAGVSLAPNPFTASATITIDNPAIDRWEVRDAVGRLVESGIVSAGNSTHSTALGADWPSGLYHWTSFGQHGFIGSLSLIKSIP